MMGTDATTGGEFTGQGGFGGWTPQFNLEEEDGIDWIRDGDRRIALALVATRTFHRAATWGRALYEPASDKSLSP